VTENDFSSRLDYIDAHSLTVGVDSLNQAGTILQYSTSPSQAAVLDLPEPGAEGSLRWSSQIQLNGRQPYIVELDFVEPDGVYEVGDRIAIRVNFSAPVLVEGTPQLLLETGSTDRRAQYSNGSGTSVLYFLYYPMPGDATSALDYYGDESALRAATNTLQLSNARILLYSSNATLAADTFLNPPGGYLEGTKAAIASGGVAKFATLQIQQRGPSYLVRCVSYPVSTNFSITTSFSVTVDPSAEFEMRNSDQAIDNRFGWSTAFENDVIVSGAPNVSHPVAEIQTVTTSGSSSRITYEVQTIQTFVSAQSEVQTFGTSADAYETVGGSFHLAYGLTGPTRALSAAISAVQLKAFLEADLADIGTVAVTRSANTYCACYSAYSWTVTFNDLVNNVQLLRVSAVKLTGTGAAISDISIITVCLLQALQMALLHVRPYSLLPA
jgi:hypothetical protein